MTIAKPLCFNFFWKNSTKASIAIETINAVKIRKRLLNDLNAR